QHKMSCWYNYLRSDDRNDCYGHFDLQCIDARHAHTHIDTISDLFSSTNGAFHSWAILRCSATLDRPAHSPLAATRRSASKCTAGNLHSLTRTVGHIDRTK